MKVAIGILSTEQEGSADEGGSFLFRRRCDTLCASGFVNDVMFKHHSQAGATHAGNLLSDFRQG